ncbi:hypothetical protein F4556_006592 [Kitasatospora gansuensis]|uniref:Uncharacterized protein n=1 Tax=Kitasatospora gansuensis TaxID=258050 RepID=A0A7W7WKP6_9ACTN|nr:hypothetical protein [Kitasatospora gansuensis]MBB4951057.1 hypothetical protein [Kitasatospora gansuensis]
MIDLASRGDANVRRYFEQSVSRPAHIEIQLGPVTRAVVQTDGCTALRRRSRPTVVPGTANRLLLAAARTITSLART